MIHLPPALKHKKPPPHPRRNVGVIRSFGSVLVPHSRATGFIPRDKKHHGLRMKPLASVNEDLRDDFVQLQDDHEDAVEVHVVTETNEPEVETTTEEVIKDSQSDSSGGDAVSVRLLTPISRSSSKTSLTSTVTTSPKAPVVTDIAKRASDADFVLPLVPFCGKCAPLKPTDCLCLKPECLVGSWKKSEDTGLKKTQDTGRAASKPAPVEPTAPKLEVPKAERTLTILPRRISFEKRASVKSQDLRMKTTLGTRKWAMALENLRFPSGPPKSRFVGCGAGDDTRDNFLCNDATKPQVLQRLTPFQITLLECFTIQHIKRLYSEVHARANLDAPAVKNRYKENMHSATICQLVRKANKKELDEVEHAFMVARLEQLPMFRDLPLGMVEGIAEKIQVHTYNKGSVIFTRGKKVDGMYILVQGDAELSEADALDTLDDGAGVKASPIALCPEDICQPCKERPFLLKPAIQRIRSRTAWVCADEDAESMATVLWVPLSVIVKAANIFRRREAQDRVDLINELFAPAMRLDRRLCEKHCHLFDLDIFPKSHAILQQGSCPPMDSARLFMVVEGEVHLMRLEKSKGGGKRSIKDKAGPGKLLGENSLYAEPSPHYAMCHTNLVKVLSIRIWDFFEKLLQRNPSTPLDKPLICAGTLENRTVGNDVGTEVVEFLDTMKAKENARRCKELALQTSRDFRILHDASVVKDTEWKTVPSKYMLNWRLPPSTRPNKAVSGSDREEASFFQEADLNYPRDSDLYPSAQRAILAEQRSFSPDGSILGPSTSRALSSTAFALCGTDSHFASLEDKIRRKLVESEELEVEHYLHSSLGVYVESADFRPRSEARGGAAQKPISGRSSSLSVRRPQTRAGGESHSARHSRNTVLWTCGATLRTSRTENISDVPPWEV